MILSLPRESDSAGEVSSLIPGIEIDPFCTSIYTGPQRGTIMRPNIQTVGEGLVEANVQDRGAPRIVSTDPREVRGYGPQGV